jgi:hypothetical protein
LTFDQAVRTLGVGPALALDAAQAVADLYAINGSDIESHDDAADRVAETVGALLLFGEASTIAAAAAAVRTYVRTASGNSGLAVTRRNVHGRLVVAWTAAALTHSNLDGLLAFRGIDVDGEPLFGSYKLRYSDGHAGDAKVSYDDRLVWISSRPWAAPMIGAGIAEGVEAAVAEADVLLALLLTAEAGRNGVFSAGLASHDDDARSRLVARLRVPRQRCAMCALFDVTDDELNDRVSELYASLPVSRGGFARPGRPLFD